MQIDRRAMMGGLGAMCASLPGLSMAQTYPARPVKLVVGLAAGGATDISARRLAQGLRDRLHQSVLVENRPGAGSIIAAELVARAPADGYTLFLGTGSYATSAAITGTLPFDPVAAFQPVLQLTSVPFCVAVHPSLGVSTLPELVARAKAEPGRLKYASTGNGGQAHFAGELFKSLTGTNLVHIPYRGAAPALTDVINGQVPVIFADVFSVLSRARNGELKIIAVISPNRAAVAEAVPTSAEQGLPDLSIVGWSIIFAPAGTPESAIETIVSATREVAANDEFRQHMANDGAELVLSPPAEAAAFFKNEIATYRRIAAEAGIKSE